MVENHPAVKCVLSFTNISMSCATLKVTVTTFRFRLSLNLKLDHEKHEPAERESAAGFGKSDLWNLKFSEREAEIRSRVLSGLLDSLQLAKVRNSAFGVCVRCEESLESDCQERNRWKERWRAHTDKERGYLIPNRNDRDSDRGCYCCLLLSATSYYLSYVLLYFLSTFRPFVLCRLCAFPLLSHLFPSFFQSLFLSLFFLASIFVLIEKRNWKTKEVKPKRNESHSPSMITHYSFGE